MPAESKHIALLCNPTRFNKKAVAITKAISVLLDKKAVQYTSFMKQWPEQLDDFTEAWIVGGDGTLNYFINHYANINVPIALFAAGTGNDFHWMMYGKVTVAEQVQRVLNGRLQHVDAGCCNDKLFLNGLGIGFDGAILCDLRGKKKRSGKLSYLLSVLKQLAWYKERQCRIIINDHILQQPCFMISVANGRRYGGGFHVAPKAQVYDGLLDVNIIGKVNLLQRLRYLPVIEKGGHLHLPFVHYQQTNSIEVECKEIMHAHLDGEYFFGKTFQVSLLSAHVSFLV